MLKKVIWQVFWTKVDYFLRLSHPKLLALKPSEWCIKVSIKPKCNIRLFTQLLFFCTTLRKTHYFSTSQERIVPNPDTWHWLKWACVCIGPFFLSFDLKFRIMFYILETWFVLWKNILDFIASYIQKTILVINWMDLNKIYSFLF